jgi:hypothetical protein
MPPLCPSLCQLQTSHTGARGGAPGGHGEPVLAHGQADVGREGAPSVGVTAGSYMPGGGRSLSPGLGSRGGVRGGVQA